MKRGFEKAVIEQLGIIQEGMGEVKGGLTAINDHLERLNGSVAEHSKRLNELDNTKFTGIGALGALKWVIATIIAATGVAVALIKLL